MARSVVGRSVVVVAGGLDRADRRVDLTARRRTRRRGGSGAADARRLRRTRRRPPEHERDRPRLRLRARVDIDREGLVVVAGSPAAGVPTQRAPTACSRPRRAAPRLRADRRVRIGQHQVGGPPGRRATASPPASSFAASVVVCRVGPVLVRQRRRAGHVSRTDPSDCIAPIVQGPATRSCTWVGSTCVAPTEPGMILRGADRVRT